MTEPKPNYKIVKGEPVCTGTDCHWYVCGNIMYHESSGCEYKGQSYGYTRFCTPSLIEQRNQLRKERDAARCELCEEKAPGMDLNPWEYAEEQGWDDLYGKETE